MLSVRHIPRTQIAIPNKWISIVHNTIRLSSNSSSSDSSDSDSDLDSRLPKQTAKMAKSNSDVDQKKDLDLYELIDHYVQKAPSKQVDIKISEKDKMELLEHRIMRAAEVLTSSVGGDKEKIVSSLLYSLSAIKSKKPTKSTEPTRKSSELKSKDAKKNTLKHERLKTRTSNENKSIISEVKSYANKRGTTDIKMERDSITWRLLRMDKKQKKPEEAIFKQLLQEQKKEASKNKLLLQRETSVTEKAWRKSPTHMKPAVSPTIKQLLKEKEEQQYTSNTSLQKKSEQVSIIKELLRKNQGEESQPPSSEEHQKQEKQPSIIQALLKNYHEQRGSRQESKEREAMRPQEPSISRMMLNQNKPRSKFQTRKPKGDYVKREAGVSPLHWILFDDDVGEEKRGQEDMSTYFNIFGETNTPSKTVELDTWNTCEEKYIKMITNHYPENAFQEMAQWTEEGKMWNFPIDNEQGMDEEHSIHFSEHVFLDRYLTGWCPTKGPIRHFMELVCIGLSKNPYMTVQEKHDTIMWYREFFADKNDLLKKLGLTEIEQNAEKQTQLAQ